MEVEIQHSVLMVAFIHCITFNILSLIAERFLLHICQCMLLTGLVCIVNLGSKSILYLKYFMDSVKNGKP